MGFMRMSPKGLADSRIALNERRKPFTPTIWELPSNASQTVLRQVWFAGCHGNVGGGNTDHALSNIALIWMIEQVKSIKGSTLEFDEDYVKTSETTIAKSTETKPWGCADYKDTYNGIWDFAGIAPRTPAIHDKNANMKIHESVVERQQWYGKQPVPWSHPDLGDLKPTTLGDLELDMRKIFMSRVMSKKP